MGSASAYPRRVRVGLEAAFPASLKVVVGEAVLLMPAGAYEPAGRFCVHVEGDVEIPERIYNPEPEPDREKALAADCRQVLACLYTRHHDGHVRQRRLNEVIHLTEAWVAPFVIRLIGEYVVEILDDIRKGLSALEVAGSLHRAQYAAFGAANPEFLELTSQRVVSYWNCYYRSQYPRLSDYPGFQLMSSLKRAAAEHG